MTAVKERSSENGYTAGEESLYRANPGNCAIVALWNKSGGVVVLKGAECIQQAPRVEEHKEAGKDL